MRVRERRRPGLTVPVLIRSDEDMPVSYSVDIEGMSPPLLTLYLNADSPRTTHPHH